MEQEGGRRTQAKALFRRLVFGKGRKDETRSADMSRSQQTRLLLSAGVIIAAFAFKFYVDSENHAALRTLDDSRCWNEQCQTDVIAAKAKLLSE